jgi:GNAT superfamily N-acetyltransferase
MVETIRAAQPADVAAMAALSQERRAVYQRYQPIFWRPAEGARQRQEVFFAHLLEQGQVIALVHEQDGAVDGFLIAQLVPAPPVYDPGGLTCLIDDFWVAEGKHWQGIGQTLLDEAIRRARARGAAQAVVVCAHLDQPKRAMLAGAAFSLASEWYVKSL